MKVESVFVIQDVITKEYYSTYMEEPAFDANLRNAYEFNEPEDALDEFIEESNIFKQEAFEGRSLLILQIHKVLT